MSTDCQADARLLAAGEVQPALADFSLVLQMFDPSAKALEGLQCDFTTYAVFKHTQVARQRACVKDLLVALRVERQAEENVVLAVKAARK